VIGLIAELSRVGAGRYGPGGSGTLAAMGVDVTAEVTIACPRDEVFAYVVNPGNDPAWIGGVRDARLAGEPPVAVGTRVERVASFLGRRIEYVNEVVALEPGRLLRMRSVVAPFPMEIAYEFEDRGAATAFRNRVQGEPGRFFALASPLVGRLVRRSVSRDLKRLRGLLER